MSTHVRSSVSGQGLHYNNEPVHEISNNVVCATSKASDQPAHTRSLIRAFASRLSYMIVKLLTEHHLEFLSLKEGCRGLSESTHVKMPPCWKSHVTAQLCHSISTIADVKWPHSNVEINCFAVLFVMMLYIPVNNFSVMSPCLLLLH